MEATGPDGLEEYQAYLSEVEQLLEGVDRALARLGDGTYGTCTVCGGPIEDARLAATPTAVRCARHAAGTPA